jgi:hypothetical protein
MEIQVKIPPALCALHNFIRHHDPTDIEDYDEGPHHGVGLELEEGDYGELSTGSVDTPERERARTRRDQIANDMWVQYQQGLHSGGDD